MSVNDESLSEAKRRRRDERRKKTGAPPPPPPPPPDENEPENVKRVREAAEELKGLKITPAVATALGQQFGLMAQTLGAVLARVNENEGWKLQPEEVEVQSSLAGTTLLLYGDMIPWMVVPIMLGVGFATPWALRIALLESPKKSNMGAPKEKAA